MSTSEVVTEAAIAENLRNDVLHHAFSDIESYALDLLKVTTTLHETLDDRVSYYGFMQIQVEVAKRILMRGYGGSVLRSQLQPIVDCGPLQLAVIPETYEAERPHHRKTVIGKLSYTDLRERYEEGKLTYTDLLLRDPGVFLPQH
jgi:hypothetical protein